MRVLVFFAHPDDETMFLGGTLSALAARGAEVHYLCATRGEGGERGYPPLLPEEDLGQIRAQELACAVRVLSGRSLHYLDYQDPPVGPEGELFPYTDLNDTFIENILSILERIRPEVVITHGPDGEYGHPAHILTHDGLVAAVSRIPGKKPAVYAPCWLSREHDMFLPSPDYLLDISPYQIQKIEAACCHRSQHDLFRRHGEVRAGKQVTVPELVKVREGLVQIQAGNRPGGKDPLIPFLEGLIVNEETQTAGRGTSLAPSLKNKKT